jgi:hypothetical protein
MSGAIRLRRKLVKMAIRVEARRKLAHLQDNLAVLANVLKRNLTVASRSMTPR